MLGNLLHRHVRVKDDKTEASEKINVICRNNKLALHCGKSGCSFTTKVLRLASHQHACQGGGTQDDRPKPEVDEEEGRQHSNNTELDGVKGNHNTVDAESANTVKAGHTVQSVQPATSPARQKW